MWSQGIFLWVPREGKTVRGGSKLYFSPLRLFLSHPPSGCGRQRTLVFPALVVNCPALSSSSSKHCSPLCLLMTKPHSCLAVHILRVQNSLWRTSLVVQWLRLCASKAGVQIRSMVRGLGPHMIQDAAKN